MAEFLKRAELVYDDSVAEMYVGRGRVCAELDAQRHACPRALFELRAQVFLADYLDRAFA